MKENEYLLYKQNIKGNNKVSADDLKALFREKPNRKILGSLPYLYAYYVGRNHLDTAKIHKKKSKILESYQIKLAKLDTSAQNKKRSRNIKKVEFLRERRDKKIDKENLKLREGNWLMRVVGEPPSLYDSANSNYNKRQMRFYLNSQGYFLNTIAINVDTIGKRITEEYVLHEGKPYTIKNLEYQIPDTSIANIINVHIKDAEQIQGKRYQESKLTAERERINRLLKDNGYFDFSPQYILIDVDSTLGNNDMAVRVGVRNPPNLEAHPRYKISKIYFNTDISRTRSETAIKRDTMLYDGIYYIYVKDNFSKKILTRKVRIQPGDFYTQSRIQLTQRQLANLDMYRFININFDKIRKDSLLTDTITRDTLYHGLIVNIRTSPQKKYQTTEEVGLNISSAGFVPGPFGSLNFKVRNAFKGFELFETNLRASVIGQSGIDDPTEIISSEEYNADASLTFPQFFFPWSNKFKTEDFSPRTRLNAGYTLIRRPEYTRGNLRGTVNYIFTQGLYTQYNISLLDLNSISTYDTSAEFSRYLYNLQAAGNPLINSFTNSIVSDINGTYTYNNNQLGNNKRSQFYRVGLESGGTSLNILRNLPFLKQSLTMGPNGEVVKIGGRSLKTYRYYRLNTDFRYYVPVKLNTFVVRLNFGYAHSYDKGGGGVLPYEKYYFMGGSNSMRGWRPRRLGPGTFANRDSLGNINYRFEQPGEIMFEMNYEYRFKIISFLEGAAFIDAGNLWTIRESAGRNGAKFNLNTFTSQIAVGPGIGLRLNFSFLILRFDLATRAIDPAQSGSNFVLFDKRGWQDPPRLNIGIGYPF